MTTRFTISVPDQINEWLESLHGDAAQYDSKSSAAANQLAQARCIDESAYTVDELLEAAERVEELKEEIEHLKATRDDLQRQLANANQRIDAANEIVEYVEKERNAQERYRHANLLQKMKWTITGVPDNERD